MSEKQEHDREMFVDEMHKRKPYYYTASEIAEDQVFRDVLIKVLIRIAEALEKPIQVRFEY